MEHHDDGSAAYLVMLSIEQAYQKVKILTLASLCFAGAFALYHWL